MRSKMILQLFISIYNEMLKWVVVAFLLASIGNCSAFSFGISLTTIPPRFPTIHHVLVSWLRQDHPPTIIVIYIPQNYTRFRNKSQTITSNADALRNKLASHESLQDKIIVVETPFDFGPITKVIGLVEMVEQWKKEPSIISSVSPPDFWVVGDDDVRYSPDTLSRYEEGIQSVSTSALHPRSQRFVLTHFKTEVRLFVASATISGHLEGVPHLQGVDTFLLSRESLARMHHMSGLMRAESLLTFLATLYRRCPESYYQDDYVLSVLFHVAGLPVKSLWNGTSVAGHVDGVSKSNFQMHMHDQVFEREEKAKTCLTQIMQEEAALMS